MQCVALPVRGPHGTLAVSVSGPIPRMTPDLLARAVPLLRESGDRLAVELAERSSA